MRLLMGGSPCTYWSIAQSTDKRETTASGIGWELFLNYVIALDKFKPEFFLYENNKSMSKEIRAQITKTFGFEPICINSALVSAQNRQRLYWVGKRNEDGTYSKVDIEQPEDRGILLKDILETGCVDHEKSHCVISSAARTTHREYFQKNQGDVVAEPVCITDDGKCQTLKAQYAKNSVANFCCYESTYGASGVAEPVCASLAEQVFGRRKGADGRYDRRYEARTDDKSYAVVSTHAKQFGMVAEPVQVGAMPRPNGELSTSQGFRIYDILHKSVTLKGNAGGAGGKTGLYAIPVEEPLIVREATKSGETSIDMGECVDMTQPNSKTRRGRNMADKSNCLTTSPQYYQYCAKLCYAMPCEWDDDGYPTKAVSFADGKTYTVYRVQDGKITIKDKTYPIKLVDDFYIIRKLTVRECMRLQTVPEWYEFPVSNSQAYKMLGNGWTVEVIKWLLSYCITDEPLDVLSMYDGMACGHIALTEMGAQIRHYWATEIDKYAIKTACHNFPDIVQLGDAFQILKSGIFETNN